MPIKGVLNKARVPVKIWADLETVESSALEQLTNTANLPFVFKHVAAMPDVHLGIGATIGSVVATKGAISPAAVGVDLGCGVIAVKTPLDPKKVCDRLPELRKEIERSVPVAHLGNTKISDSVRDWKGWDVDMTSLLGDDKLIATATRQLGSLGGGNHFIEICLDNDHTCPHCKGIGERRFSDSDLAADCETCGGSGMKAANVWVMLHSGSRNVGKTLAERHIDSAKGIMKQLFINLPDPNLAYFAEETDAFNSYMMDLLWCQDYAARNRVEMMDRILRQLSYMFNEQRPIPRLLEVNCHHNYVARENHYGENVLVTRKGAVRARVGDLGIIPGSMGTKSYIVKGLGNPESFCSCSHGAGRRMSRGEAKRRFTLADLSAQTAGVDCRKDEGVLDEIPGAYKDIDVVMENQKDLVEIVATLKQVLCVKG